MLMVLDQALLMLMLVLVLSSTSSRYTHAVRPDLHQHGCVWKGQPSPVNLRRQVQISSWSTAQTENLTV